MRSAAHDRDAGRPCTAVRSADQGSVGATSVLLHEDLGFAQSQAMELLGLPRLSRGFVDWALLGLPVVG
jgi:hypothetical protein